MSNNIKLWGAALMIVALGSCSDYLTNEPMDFGDETAYFKTAADFQLSTNAFYEFLPKMGINNSGLYSDDNNSDNQIGTLPSTLFYKGDKRTVLQSQSEWNFGNLRAINYFLNVAEPKYRAGKVSGNEALIRNYLGEGYFFRAYDYLRLLRNYGDLPILTQMLPDDPRELAARSRRAPRTEVVRWMLQDLDRAITLLAETPVESGRVCKDAARLLKARVALYEATWQRYHAGTVFATGSDKWQALSGQTVQWTLGSAEAEINWLLEEGYRAADTVAANRALDADYAGMFNNTGTFDNGHEVILARYYKPNVITHSASNWLGRTGAGTGLTRALVNSFLTQNGLPIYAPGNTEYQGDEQIYDEMVGRDLRLQQSCKGGGLITTTEGDTISYYRPHVNESGNQGSTTGYEILKWVSAEPGQDAYTQGTTATPLLRAAEAYLIYLEAYYERHHALDSKCDAYWRALRTRAGVDPDYTKTIAATDLTQENDLAVRSHGQLIDPTLYNIRRERRCEFVAEGMRLDDLRRWRALDEMKDYQPEGINFWAKMYTYYKPSERAEGIVSQKSISTYLHPLQKSTSIACYQGYDFPKAHYLEPIPVSEFKLCQDGSGHATLYQNPGWPTIDGPADYSFDCE